MKIYISGQITGLHLAEARINFENAETFLKAQSHEVVNPMKAVPFDKDKTWKDYMVEDISLLLDCDGIYMLDNWGRSKGARIERAIAIEMGLKIFYQ